MLHAPPGVYSWWLPPLVAVVAVVLATLGYTVLRRYPRNIVKLRGYLEQIAGGELPAKVLLTDPEDDIAAIERYLNTVIDQLRAKVRSLEEQLHASRRMQQTIETQAAELVQAERQRVMIESLGAACHHIGQPATVLRVYLGVLRKENLSGEAEEKLERCEAAIDAIATVLEKLRQVGTYRTVPYATRPVDDDEEGEPRTDTILDIDP
jgi:phosphoglycerate-specific signal transduction histidine kinase